MSNCNTQHRLRRTFHTNKDIHISSSPALYVIPLRALRDFVSTNKIELEFNEVISNSLQFLPANYLPTDIDEERIKILNDENTWTKWKNGEQVTLFYDGALVKYQGKMNLEGELSQSKIKVDFSPELNQPQINFSIGYTPSVTYANRPELFSEHRMDLSYSQWLDIPSGAVNNIWNKPNTLDRQFMKSLAGTYFLVFSRAEQTIDLRLEGPEDVVHLYNFIRLDSSSSELDISIKAEEFAEMVPFSFSLEDFNWNFNQIKE